MAGVLFDIGVTTSIVGVGVAGFKKPAPTKKCEIAFAVELGIVALQAL
jgi:hypothetical protein